MPLCHVVVVVVVVVFMIKLPCYEFYFNNEVTNIVTSI